MVNVDIRNGDCLDVLRDLPDNSVDSIVTDPPYGLSSTKPKQIADVLAAWVTGNTEAVPTKKGGFMGKDWDSFVPPPAVWEECLRVLKPGGHMAAFAGARTQDLMGLSIRLAGFEIRDSLGWVYGSGFPKSHDIGKAIEKAAGADEAKQWDGWGTALKPAIEPIVLARKPLVGTVANNVLTHGAGGLNIDACRVGNDVRINPSAGNKAGGASLNMSAVGMPENVPGREAAGRFPANVLLDEHAAAAMDKQSGNLSPGARPGNTATRPKFNGATYNGGKVYDGKIDEPRVAMDSGGGASRFFPVFRYQAKAPKRERPVIVREDGTKIQHPTVKPLALLDWLVTLTTPPGGLVLDPFAGTGTTLQAARDKGFNSIGIEQDADYIQLIETRLSTN